MAHWMIAITGASGLIGTALTAKLKQPFRMLEEDLCKAHHRDFLKGCGSLIHLATPLHARTQDSALANSFLAATQSLFREFRSLQPTGKIFFASTGGEVYDSSTDMPMSETSPVFATSDYSGLKIESE